MALLHLKPVLGDINANRKIIENAVKMAASQGAVMAVTPETFIPGYHFAKRIGTDWIEPQPDSWLQEMIKLSAELGITLFLSYQERDKTSENLYNTVYAISKKDGIVGSHRKMGISSGHTAEAWASAGSQVNVIACDGMKAGILVCADTWGPKFAAELKEKGAQVLISPAAWPPLPCPPEGCWEKRSEETGLPIWVCNRTGNEPELDFSWGESIVAVNGHRLMEYSDAEPAILLFEWDMAKNHSLQAEFTVIPLT